MSKTASAIVIALVCLLFFPVIVGIAGGVFGAVFGIIGGLIGAVFGVIGGLIGAVFGFFGWILEAMFDWDGPFDYDWNFFTIVAIILVVALLAKKSQHNDTSRR